MIEALQSPVVRFAFVRARRSSGGQSTFHAGEAYASSACSEQKAQRILSGKATSSIFGSMCERVAHGVVYSASR